MRRRNSRLIVAYTRLTLSLYLGSNSHWNCLRMLQQGSRVTTAWKLLQHMNHRIKPFRITRNGNDISLLACLYPRSPLVHYEPPQRWLYGALDSILGAAHATIGPYRSTAQCCISDRARQHGKAMQCAAAVLHCMRWQAGTRHGKRKKHPNSCMIALGKCSLQPQRLCRWSWRGDCEAAKWLPGDIAARLGNWWISAW